MRPLRVPPHVPLHILILGALLCLAAGNVLKEIFTRTGSDLLLPITRHLTLSHADGRSCDEFSWNYKDPSRDTFTRIARHRRCKLTEYTNISNARISENRSLIISNVTLENDGIYSVIIHNPTGQHIQTDNYTVHVQVPVSVPVLDVSCLRNGSAEISCRVEKGTKPNIRLSVIGGSRGNYSASSNNITTIVGSPGPWNVTCSAMNGVSRLEESRAGVTCPVPLSDIAVKTSCLPDGSAEVVCSVNGSDPNYSWSLDGKKISSQSRMTLPPPVSGIFRCDVTNTINNQSEWINISCAVPVSVPVVDVECLQNGSAEISCKVGKGTHFSINLTISGSRGELRELEEYKVTSSERTVRVTVPPMSLPNLWHISCLVKNNISQSSSHKMDDTCHARLSAPHILVSCQSDGSARVSCVTGKDPDVTYQWKVNGEFLPEHLSPNITFTKHNFTSDPLNVSCTAHHRGSQKHSDTSQILCPGQTSCLSCWQKSMIGGFVALLVAFPPLFISHWYILRGMDKKSKTLVT